VNVAGERGLRYFNAAPPQFAAQLILICDRRVGKHFPDCIETLNLHDNQLYGKQIKGAAAKAVLQLSRRFAHRAGWFFPDGKIHLAVVVSPDGNWRIARAEPRSYKYTTCCISMQQRKGIFRSLLDRHLLAALLEVHGLIGLGQQFFE